MLIVLGLLLALATVVVVGLRRRRHDVRDDTRRIGDDVAVDGQEAARRAQGRAAWTRFTSGL